MDQGAKKETRRKGSSVIGRGLESLLGEIPSFVNDNQLAHEVSIDLVDNDPTQPRRAFDEEKINELADSIKVHGLIQPLLVTKQQDGRYRIIAGERRFRAARKAGLKNIPVIVRDVTASETLQLALIENVQREDLNPIEQARAMERLVTEHGLTQEQVAQQVGKSRSSVANILRLTLLPQDVTDLITNGTISLGHAKALLGLPTPEAMSSTAAEVVRHALSVRQTEDLVREKLEAMEEDATGSEMSKQRTVAKKKNPFAEAQAQLTEALGTKVRIAGTETKGRITIEYVSKEQLENLFEQLKAMHEEED